MNLTVALFIFGCLAIVVGAIMTIKKSANKFMLTEEQKKKIHDREIEQKKKDEWNN